MKCTRSWYEEPPYNEVDWDQVEEHEAELERQNWVPLGNHPSDEPLYYPPNDDLPDDDLAPF